MSAPTDLPPAAAIFQFATGIWAAQAVGAFARLGVADHLANGPRSSPDLAERVGANPEALYRLLRGVASVGIVTMDADRRFKLTAVGDCLRTGIPGSARSFIIAQTSPAHWLPWGQFTESVRTGKPTTEAVLGSNIWDYYKKHPEEASHFAEAMSGVSAMAMHAVMASYSFAGATRVVDVGGSHGSFLAAVLGKVPAARGVLFDLPHVIDGARGTLEAAGISDRVDRVGGSFFESVPVDGDVYLLKSILHDWSDDECVTILKNIASAMTHDGRVVVAEMWISDGPQAGPPSPAPLLDLNMLVLLSGKERTAEEFGALFAKAGLKLTKVVPTASPFAVIEAHKA